MPQAQRALPVIGISFAVVGLILLVLEVVRVLTDHTLGSLGGGLLWVGVGLVAIGMLLNAWTLLALPSNETTAYAAAPSDIDEPEMQPAPAAAETPSAPQPAPVATEVQPAASAESAAPVEATAAPAATPPATAPAGVTPHKTAAPSTPPARPHPAAPPDDIDIGGEGG